MSIQHSHGVPCDSYTSMPITTGGEKAIAHRTGKLFATTAKKPGKVIRKTSYAIVVEHEDGTQTGIELGRRFGKSAGSVFPHDLVTDLKVGDEVPLGRVIAWNQKFFEKDQLDPTAVRWKVGTLAYTAILDGADTFEDSSALSEHFAAKMATETTRVRPIVVDFNERVVGLVKEGQAVEPDSILCTIQDSVSTSAGLFEADSDAINALQLLSDATPKAKYKGIIDKIDVVYNGELEEMDESLQTLAIASDRRMAKIAEGLGELKAVGKVEDDSYRIDGKRLMKNQCAILVYNTSRMGAGVGDKFVFGLQLKSITCRIMTGVNRTVSGIPLDAYFSYQSISNRIVNSAEDIGILNTMVIFAADEAFKIYEGKSDD